jgi:hypothetical protein
MPSKTPVVRGKLPLNHVPDTGKPTAGLTRTEPLDRAADHTSIGRAFSLGK